MIKKTYMVTGHQVEASYTEEEVTDLFMPLLNQLTELKSQTENRVIVFLAAPPGAGKTTLSLFLEDLYKDNDYPYTFQAISMDGFHHKNQYLDQQFIERNGEKVLLRKLKGIPETFDLQSLHSHIKALKTQKTIGWPIYDRMLHDVSPDTQKVDADIVLVEGNYLLLDKEGWNDLHQLCDLSVMIKAPVETVKDRLVKRKQRGGTSEEEAELHYERTDRVNGELVMSHSVEADLTYNLTGEGRLIK